jgi:hypothetical protein
MGSLSNQVRAGLRYLQANLADGALQARIQDALDGLPDVLGTESIHRIIAVLQHLRKSTARQFDIKMIDPLIGSLQSSLPRAEEPREYGAVQMSLVSNDATAVRFELDRLAALCVEGACARQGWDTSRYRRERLVLTHRNVLREYRRKNASHGLGAKLVKLKRSWTMTVSDLQYVAACTNGFLHCGGPKERGKAARRRKS